MANEKLKQNFKDIADSIRTKSGKSGKLDAAEMVTEINALDTSGIHPTGTKDIVANGNNIDVTNYAAVNVNVPSVQPTGNTEITVSELSSPNPINVANYGTVTYENFYTKYFNSVQSFYWQAKLFNDTSTHVLYQHGYHVDNRLRSFLVPSSVTGQLLAGLELGSITTEPYGEDDFVIDDYWHCPGCIFAVYKDSNGDVTVYANDKNQFAVVSRDTTYEHEVVTYHQFMACFPSPTAVYLDITDESGEYDCCVAFLGEWDESAVEAWIEENKQYYNYSIAFLNPNCTLQNADAIWDHWKIGPEKRS